MSIHLNGGKYLQDTGETLPGSTNTAQFIWFKPNLAAQTQQWGLAYMGITAGVDNDMHRSLHFASGQWAFSQASSTNAIKYVSGSYAITDAAWQLASGFMPGETVASDVLTARLMDNASSTTGSNSGSATPPNFDVFQVGRRRDNISTTTAEDCKFAGYALYTGIDLATYNSLHTTAYNDYGVSGEFKSPLDPAMLEIAVPYWCTMLDDSLDNAVQASSTIAWNNVGTASFDSGDNPVFAAIAPPTITTVRRPRWIGI